MIFALRQVQVNGEKYRPCVRLDFILELSCSLNERSNTILLLTKDIVTVRLVRMLKNILWYIRGYQKISNIFFLIFSNTYLKHRVSPSHHQYFRGSSRKSAKLTAERTFRFLSVRPRSPGYLDCPHFWGHVEKLSKGCKKQIASKWQYSSDKSAY